MKIIKMTLIFSVFWLCLQHDAFTMYDQEDDEILSINPQKNHTEEDSYQEGDTEKKSRCGKWLNMCATTIDCWECHNYWWRENIPRILCLPFTIPAAFLCGLPYYLCGCDEEGGCCYELGEQQKRMKAAEERIRENQHKILREAREKAEKERIEEEDRCARDPDYKKAKEKRRREQREENERTRLLDAQRAKKQAEREARRIAYHGKHIGCHIGCCYPGPPHECTKGSVHWRSAEIRFLDGK